jgi:hypothetical protein
MTQTKPTSEQLVFNSATTGVHSLDEYLQNAESGGKTLAELMTSIFDDTTGAFKAIVDRGVWAPATVYAVGDVVRNGYIFYMCKTAHTSAGSFSGTNWNLLWDFTTPVTDAINAANAADADATTAATQAGIATTQAGIATTKAGEADASAIAAAASAGSITWASPGTIGSTTPNTGSFTTLAASGTVSGAGFTALLASPGPIGSTAASTGAFTTLSATGNVNLNGGTFIFNDSGADLDARFEGDTDANLFFIDASTDRVGIGTNTPRTKLDVNGLTSLESVMEDITLTASAATGTINFDVLTQSIHHYTTNAAANWTLNIRGNSGNTLNSIMAVGQCLTVCFMATQGGTAYYCSQLQIDGSNVTPLWVGQTAPVAGNASGRDIYRYSIVKTANATFTVYATMAKAA